MMVFNDSSQNFFFYFYILWLIYCFFNHKKRKDRAWSRKKFVSTSVCNIYKTYDRKI